LEAKAMSVQNTNQALPKMGKVAVIKTSPKTVIEDYARLLELADFKNYLNINNTTILKNNISWHQYFPGANTTPWQMEGVTKKMLADEYKDLVVVQNRTVVTNAYKGQKLNKYEGLFKKYNLNVKYNFLPEDTRWIKYEPKGKMLVLSDIFKDGIYIPEYFIGKNILHLPTVKGHIYSTTTGSMKNAFGGLLATNRHWCHSEIHKTLVDLLKIQKEIHTGIFTATDGTVCGNGPGPRTMTPEIHDYILASGDCVAIDSISSKMMGFDPMKLEYIRVAHEEGLGIGNPSEIEVVGDDIKNVNFNFKVGNNAASSIGNIFWFGPFKHLQKLMFRTPLVNIFIFGSFIYHDYFWYPLKGKKYVDEYLKTEWGKLFMQY